jgi:hypothetical protein
VSNKLLFLHAFESIRQAATIWISEGSLDPKMISKPRQNWLIERPTNLPIESSFVKKKMINKIDNL